MGLNGAIEVEMPAFTATAFSLPRSAPRLCPLLPSPSSPRLARGHRSEGRHRFASPRTVRRGVRAVLVVLRWRRVSRALLRMPRGR
jgi:hypothetical protein